jgi:hypothetical protein
MTSRITSSQEPPALRRAVLMIGLAALILAIRRPANSKFSNDRVLTTPPERQDNDRSTTGPIAGAQ